jgi:hypothetical protein
MGLDHWDQINNLIRDMYAAAPEEAQSICRRLLRKTLADGLTPTSWDVLEAIVDLDHLWTWKDLPALLAEFRLPTTRDTLRDACVANAGTGRIDV